MTALFTPLGGLQDIPQVPENAIVIVGTEDGWGTTTLAALRSQLLEALTTRVTALEQSAAKWLIVNDLTTLAPNKRYLADARNGSFDLHFPEVIEPGQPFEVAVVGGSVHLELDEYTLIGDPTTTLVSGRVFKFVALDLVTIVSIP